jgi:hypothetical protein
MSSTPQSSTPQNQLTLADVHVLVNVIRQGTVKGAFSMEDMSAIVPLYNKMNKMLQQANAAEAEEKKN